MSHISKPSFRKYFFNFSLVRKSPTDTLLLLMWNLLVHQVDDVVGRVKIHLHRVGVLKAEDVACELDDHALHAQTDAECGHIVLTAPLQGHELAFDAALSESGSHDDAVHVAETLVDISFGEFLGVDVDEPEFVVLTN